MNLTRIRDAFERKVRAMTRREGLGHGTAVTRVRVVDGLACEVEEGPWRFAVDMSEQAGGTETGPNPGVLGRGALGSCIAVGYMLWAARLGVPVDGVEVEVEADYNARAEYGVEEGPAGYSEVRCRVTVRTAADEADVRRLADAVEARAAYLDIFRRAIPVRSELRIARDAVRAG